MNTPGFPFSTRKALWPLSAAASVLLFSSQGSQAADWPQYRGGNHDGASAESVLKTWPASVREVWKVAATNGFSTFTVADGIAATVVGREGKETCVALDAATGKELWAAPSTDAKFDRGGESGTPNNNGGDGPRSTPTIDDGKVYALSGLLTLSCYDAKTGKVVWSKDLKKEFAGKTFTWQSAASPLIDGDLLFVNTASTNENASIMAFNKKDGTVAWKAGTEKSTHSTPVVATIQGTRQVIFLTQWGLVSLASKTGAELWRYAFPIKSAAGASPVVSGDIVYCAACYEVGSAAVKISKEGDAFKATELWRLKGSPKGNHWSTPVVKDGYVYGLFDHGKYGSAPLKCLELATGKEMWSQPGFGPGGLMLVSGNLVVLSDTGKLFLVEGSSDGYKELGSYQALAGKCWNTFALSNGRLYLRSTKEGVCLDVSGK